MKKIEENKIIWAPQGRQQLMMSRTEFEALYGGAAGGGKSDYLIAEALRQVHVPYYRAIIFRKTIPELEDLIGRSHELYQNAYPKAKYNEVHGGFRVEQSSILEICSIQKTN